MFKNLKMSLTYRLLLSVLGAVLVMNVILLVSIGISSSKKAEKAGIDLAISKSKEAAGQVKMLLNKPSQGVTILNDVVLGMIESNQTGREALDKASIRMLKSNPSFNCVWIQMEPHLFDKRDNSYLNDPRYSGVKGAANITYYKNKGEIGYESPTLDMYQADWYLDPINNKCLTITEPYMYSYSGAVSDSMLISTVAFPIMKNGTTLGVAGIDVSLQSLNEICQAAKLYDTGFATILSDKLKFASHKNAKKVGTPLSGEIKTKYAEATAAIENNKNHLF